MRLPLIPKRISCTGLFARASWNRSSEEPALRGTNTPGVGCCGVRPRPRSDSEDGCEDGDVGDVGAVGEVGEEGEVKKDGEKEGAEERVSDAERLGWSVCMEKEGVCVEKERAGERVEGLRVDAPRDGAELLSVKSSEV